MHRLQYQNYPRTCLWTHLWTYLMLEIQCLIHNQFKPRPMVCRSCLFQDVYPVMPEILQIISIITVVCISEGVGQAPPVFPLHHRQNMEYWKVQWKHSYLTFWFVGNYLTLTIHKYCDFNEAPTFSVIDGCGTRLKQKTSHLVTPLSWNFRSLMGNRNQHNHPWRPGRFKVYSVWRYMP